MVLGLLTFNYKDNTFTECYTKEGFKGYPKDGYTIIHIPHRYALFATYNVSKEYDDEYMLKVYTEEEMKIKTIENATDMLQSKIKEYTDMLNKTNILLDSKKEEYDIRNNN